MSCSNNNEDSASTAECCWKGTSLSDIYKSQDPWSFYTTPVSPSKYHKVLYRLPNNSASQDGGPPKPQGSPQPKHWDDDHVRMPFSSESLYIVKQDGQDVIRPRWDVITESLLRPINSSEELEKCINMYNDHLPRFAALHRFFNEVLDETESQYFFSEILPGIVRLALQLPTLITGSLPLLKKNFSRSLSLSQMQAASLLANSFLCTFVWNKETAKTYPGPNFARLFAADHRPKRQSCVSEKLKSICHYFRRVLAKPPTGCITFQRKFIHRSEMPRWDTAENNLGNTRIHVTSEGLIEDASGLLQVDFANKFIGGGVLGYGCVQEEIRFMICPELIISRLFVEELGDHEAVEIKGIERFSSYSGYGDTYKWEGNYQDRTPFDDYGRRKTNLVVIDAIRFNRVKDQFYPSSILREVNKAYVGFSSRAEKQNLSPVASGNWGCGAFKGDPHLKALIQLMACSAAQRDLVYFSFGNTELMNEFYNMHLFLANNRIKICELWRYLCRFCVKQLPADQLYSFIQQAHFDSKSQPTITKFLASSTSSKNKQNCGKNSQQESSKIENKKIGEDRTITDDDKAMASCSSSISQAGSSKYEQLPIDVLPRIFNKNQDSDGSRNTYSASKRNRNSPLKSSPEKLKKTKTVIDPDDLINIMELFDGNSTSTMATTTTTTTTKTSDTTDPAKTNDERPQHSSFLQEIDNMKKESFKIESPTSNSQNTQEMTDCSDSAMTTSNSDVEMTDYVDVEAQMAQGQEQQQQSEEEEEEGRPKTVVSYIEEKRRKITDYFCKITKS